MTNLFSNSPFDKSFTINFFTGQARWAKSAQLACPFFTDPEPIKILKQSGCDPISLIVRLCESTSPDALAEVLTTGGVNVRFFTARTFHAKFYILGEVALVGSANMTDSGMKKNRELSVVLHSGDEGFDEIPALFEELWGCAGVLTDDVFKKFADWRRRNVPRDLPPIEGIGEFSPMTIAVSTQIKNPTRVFLETFRANYKEQLLPAHAELVKLYHEHGHHPAFKNAPRAYEIYQFLYWIRGLTTNGTLLDNPLRTGEDRRRNLSRFISDWFRVEEPPIFPDSENRISGLKNLFSDKDALLHVQMNVIADLLQGCAAFAAMQRFTKGGLENHIRKFKTDNRIKIIRESFCHLKFGDGDYVQRIYDCVYLARLRLRHFGRNSLFELFGWVNDDEVPPLNGRAIEALRFLGFDVPFLDIQKLEPKAE